MTHSQNKADQSGFKYLILICGIAAIGGFLFGFDTAVISGVVGFVKSEYGMSAAKEGWFVSVALLGCIIGVAAAGKLSDSYGRKKVLLLSALLFTVSAIGCCLVVPESLLIGFRFIGGLGIGVASMVSPLYITEFAPPRLRGRLVAIYQLAITLGILAAYFSNAWLLGLSTGPAGSLHGSFWQWIIHDHVWRSMLGMGVLPAIIFMGSLLFIPESPRWLMTNGRATQASKWVHKVNTPMAAEIELAAIRTAVHGPEDKKNKKGLKELTTPLYRTALIIGLLLPALSQFSGINAVIYYGPRILDAAGFSLGGAFGGQVSIGIINMLFTFVAIFTVDKWGRRPLLLVGTSIACLALGVIGFLFFKGVTQGPWILLFILLYIACFAFSFGPVCWIIVGEIFPTHIRGRAMGLATLSLWVANFFVGWLTPVLLDRVGPAGTFWIFAVLCAPTIWLTIELIPETKGHNLEEITLYWEQRAHKK
jgi:SP family arabinose:H+ symporter-like MFS transporter